MLKKILLANSLAKRSLDEMPKMEGSKAMGQLVAGSTKVEASLDHPSTSRGATSLY